MKYIAIVLIILLLPQLYYYIKDKRHEAIDDGSKFYKKIEVKSIENYREFYLTGADGFDIFVRELEKERPKGIVQLVHGMSEHGGNYMDFAKFLNDKGYVVIVHDHRGHGRSLSESYPKGHMKRASELVGDTVLVSSYVKLKYPSLPLYMLGHSMGSMTARVYLQRYDRMIDKLILTGTPVQDPLAGLLVFFLNIVNFYTGAYRRANLINHLVGNSDASLDFISYNEENRQKKYKDPLRIFSFTMGYTKVLVEINKKLSQKSKYKVKNPNLPIYNLTGEDDIITKGSKGIEKSLSLLKSLGYKNIKSKSYQNMRHEILNEDEKEMVYWDILGILED